MKWLLRVFGCAAGAAIATAGIALFCVIWLMFSSGSEEGRRTGYFGSVFVEVHHQASGAMQLGAGLLTPVPFVVTFLAMLLFLLATLFLYDRLLRRRELLLASQPT